MSEGTRARGRLMPAPFAMPCRGSCVALWGPAAVCAGGRRPAREIATREPAAWSDRSRGPPWPCRHPPALRPGPAAHGRRSEALRSLRCPPYRRRLVRINFARNSAMAVSNSEFRSLELQCFGTLLNVHPIELRASFLRSGHIGTCWCRSRSPQTGHAVVGYRRRLCSLVRVWG